MSHTGVLARFGLATVSAASGLLIGMLVATSASADTTFYGYVRSDPRGADRDPVNIVYRAAGGLEQVLSSFSHAVGWPDNGGSTMYFLDSGTHQVQDAQRSSACGGCDRYHTRFQAATDPSSSTTLGAAHYEVTSWCGHASRSFDNARDMIVDDMAASGSTISWSFWGNTKASLQCDGYEVAGDGWIARITVR